LTRRLGAARVAGVAFALAVVSVLATLPSGTVGDVSTTRIDDVSSVAGSVAGSELSAILAQPWTMRAGFDPTVSAEVAGATPLANGSVEIVLTLAPSNTGFLTAAPGPALNASEIGAEYGASESSYNALVQYFAGFGLSVLHAWPDRLFLSLEGTPASVNAAFGTTLAAGSYAGRSVRFPMTAPSLPAGLESEISAVSGLSQGFTMFSVPLEPAELPRGDQGRTTTTVTPSAAHLLYGLDGLYNYSGGTHWATGIGIATILWGEGYNPSDLKGFFSSYYPGGFPAVTIQAYPVDGAPSPSPGAVNDPSNVTSEMTLDIEWAGSAAPGATIDAVYAPDGPASDSYSPSDAALEDALNTASQQIPGVDVISMSFGSPDGQDLSFQAAYETALKAATLAGQTVLAASGDNGGVGGGACTGTVTPEYPAASQWVVAVGGTAPVISLNALGTVTGLDSEPAWNRSGGGYSTTYGEPAWQTSLAGPTDSRHRGIPDVAGPAQDNIFFYDGSEAAGAGTSFAAPFWAGIVAEMDAIRGTPLGYITPRLYSVGIDETEGTAAIGLADITSGGNCLGAATAGWDTVTGWGSPRANFLYPDLDQTFVNVSLVTSVSSVAPGGSFGAIATITNSSDHTPIAGLNVTITVDSPGYIGPCGGPFANTALVTGLNGTASTAAGIPSCYLGSSVVVTATVSGKYYGSSLATVHVNLVGLAQFLSIVEVFPYNVITFALLVILVALAGWRIGEWNHRRRVAKGRRDRQAPVGAGPPKAGGSPEAGPAPSSTPGSPPSEPPTPPSAVPAVVAPVAAGGSAPMDPEGSFPPMESPLIDGGPAAPIEVPAHVAEGSVWTSPDPLTNSPAESSDVPDHVRGEPVSPPTLCPSCGAALPGDTDACPACGASIGRAVSL
jgi:kumamolisin